MNFQNFLILKSIANLGLKPYKFKFGEQKTLIFEIEQTLIAYHLLDEQRFDSKEKILIFGGIEKLERIIKECCNLINNEQNRILYCRGSSGTGKTFALSLSTLIMKNDCAEKLRIIYLLTIFVIIFYKI